MGKEIYLKQGDTTDIDFQELKIEMKNELERLLGFWLTEGVDAKNGGFIGRINHYGEKDWKAPKGVVLSARVLWAFSSAYLNRGDEKYKKAANQAYKYLVDNFCDTENGGLIWEVDYKGNPLNKRKQTYAQGFGIYAFSEYYKSTGEKEGLEYAKSLYEILEDKFLDRKHLGYIEALDNDWSQLVDMRLSEKDANQPKSMNTHLHILEPYTNLYKVWPNERLKKSIKTLLDIFQFKIMDKKTGHLNLFFGMDWKINSSIVSFGHDIETAWLMNEAANEVGDVQLKKEIRQISLKLVNLTISKGMDKDCSIFNEKNGETIDLDKHWWAQAEALVGLFDAWENSHDPEYLVCLGKTWEFIKNKIMDKENGEWYWRVDNEGKACTSEDKIGIWKCPYHNSRALMEVLKRMEKIS